MPESEKKPAPVSMHRTQRRAQLPANPRPVPLPVPGLYFRLPITFPKTPVVDLTRFSRPRLAGEIAEIIWDDHHARTGFKSHGVVMSTMVAVRAFDAFLKEEDTQGDINAFADVTSDHVDDFDVWAHASWPEGSTSPYTMLGDLIDLLRRALQHGFALAALEPRLDYTSKANVKVETTPWDAYSPFVMEQIRRDAKREVRRTVLRLAKYRKRSDTDCLREALGEAGMTLIGGDYDTAYHRRIAKWLSSRNLPPLAQFLDRFYPRLPDLVPFALLIADDCGLSPSSIHGLLTNCVTTSSDEAGFGFVHYRKSRRHQDQRLLEEPIKTRARWSTGWLVALLLAITKNARAHLAEDEKQALFVGRAGWRIAPLMIADTTYARYLRDHPITEADGTPLTSLQPVRIRKSVKVDRYEAGGGDVGTIGDDHSKETFGRYYGNVAALQGTHDASIEASLAAGLRDALQATVLTEAEARRLETDPAAMAAELGRSEAEVRAVANGASDVWLAGCLNFEDSPFAVPGKRGCGAPLWGCLDCRNAVITPSKLPSLIHLLAHLLRQRQEMSLSAFKRSFGIAYVRLQQILDRFPPEAVEAALKEAGDYGRDWSLAQLTYKV